MVGVGLVFKSDKRFAELAAAIGGLEAMELIMGRPLTPGRGG